MSAFALELPGWDCPNPACGCFNGEAKHERVVCRACGVRIEKGRYAVRIVTHPVILKECACGLDYTLHDWELLPYVGRQDFEWGEVHELRNCHCGSTLVKVIEEGPG